MESESKLQPNGSIDEMDQKQVENVRNDLLRCPNLDPDSDAMKVALTALEEVEEIIKVKVQLEMKNDSIKQNKTNCFPHTGVAIDTSYTKYYKHQPTIPKHINIDVKRDHNEASQIGTKNVSINEPKQLDTTRKNEDKQNTKSSIGLKILRTITVDLPLLSLFLLTLLTFSLSHVYDNYLGPQIEYMKYTDENRTHDISYYHRVCPLGEMSTTKVEDLLIGDDFTTDECVEHMMVHGTLTKSGFSILDKIYSVYLTPVYDNFFQ